MNLNVTGFLLIVALASGAEIRRANPHTQAFHDFMNKHERHYKIGSEEYQRRLALFAQRKTEADVHNARPDKRWTSSVNHLWDYTDDELRELRGWNGFASPGRGRGQVSKMSYLNQESDPPEQMLNWTELESLKEVANQGHCGSCWAVSTSVVLKANAEIHHSAQRSFSAQEMVNCVPNPKSCGGEGGCKGATVELALNYVMHMGLGTADEVPYKAKTQECGRFSQTSRASGSLSLAGRAQEHHRSEDDNEDDHDDESSLSEVEEEEDEEAEEEEDFDDLTAAEELQALEKLHSTSDFQSAGLRSAKADSAGLVSMGITGWEKLPENEMLPLMRALYIHGPVGVSVAAKDWHRYGTGVFDGCSQDAVIDHAVTLIAYGQDAETHDKFWMIQNSWGKGWGEDGRIRLLRRMDDDKHCGMDSQPEKGTACKGGPEQVKVCGMCGILYDSVVPHFQQQQAPLGQASHLSN